MYNTRVKTLYFCHSCTAGLPKTYNLSSPEKFPEEQQLVLPAGLQSAKFQWPRPNFSGHGLLGIKFYP